MTIAPNMVGGRWVDGDNWQAVPGCPCRTCEDAAAAARPRTTLRLGGDVEIVLEMRADGEPAPLARVREDAAKADGGAKALEALKRMGWLS